MLAVVCSLIWVLVYTSVFTKLHTSDACTLLCARYILIAVGRMQSFLNFIRKSVLKGCLKCPRVGPWRNPRVMWDLSTRSAA